MTRIEVVRAGWATTVQDHGRAGYAALGVPGAGPVDPALHALVNRVAGNPGGAAALETAGSLVLRCDGPAILVTSSELAPIAVADGDEVAVGPQPGETWGYLAVRGGLVVEPVLGSASHDTLAGLGPPAVVDGTTFEIGADPATAITVDQVPPPRRPDRVRIWPGPRLDWFPTDAFAQLLTGPWSVSARTSRVGVRLDGPALARVRRGELPSEGLVTGAVQVPPDGQPVVMLADHPTTGGYPVVAVVDPADVGHLAQRRPGTPVRFAVAGRG